MRPSAAVRRCDAWRRVRLCHASFGMAVGPLKADAHCRRRHSALTTALVRLGKGRQPLLMLQYEWLPPNTQATWERFQGGPSHIARSVMQREPQGIRGSTHRPDGTAKQAPGTPFLPHGIPVAGVPWRPPAALLSQVRSVQLPLHSPHFAGVCVPLRAAPALPLRHVLSGPARRLRPHVPDPLRAWLPHAAPLVQGALSAPRAKGRRTCCSATRAPPYGVGARVTRMRDNCAAGTCGKKTPKAGAAARALFCGAEAALHERHCGRVRRQYSLGFIPPSAPPPLTGRFGLRGDPSVEGQAAPSSAGLLLRSERCSSAAVYCTFVRGLRRCRETVARPITTRHPFDLV